MASPRPEHRVHRLSSFTRRNGRTRSARDKEALIDTRSTRIPTELLGATVVVGDPTDVPGFGVDGLTQLISVVAVPELTAWSDERRAVISHTDIADIEVLDGRTVTVSPRPGANAERIRALLFGIGATVVLAQQGRFALHASTVEIDGRCVAVSGRSGAGKSTTAMRLAQRGGRPIVDDVTVLDLRDGLATTSSWGRDVHIWPHVADELSIDTSEAVMMGGPRRKWAMSWPETDERVVHDVVVLRPAPVPAPRIDLLPPLHTQRLLGRSAHYAVALRHVWTEAMFDWQVALSRAVRVALLRRPDDGSTLDEVCELIEEWVGQP